MKVLIDEITINSANRSGVIEAEIEFNDSEAVIKEFGETAAIDALGKTDLLNEIGWTEAEEYFSDEIQEKIDEAVTEAKKDAAEEIAQLEARIAELQA